MTLTADGRSLPRRRELPGALSAPFRTVLSAVLLMSAALACSAPTEDSETPADAAQPTAAELTAVPDVLTQEEEAVLETVLDLFRAMRTSDGELAAAVFHPEARMGRRTEEGGIAFGTADGFIEAIGRPKEQVWDEPIWDVVVNVDGQLAQAWTPYAFYLDGEYSHCGVDAFQLYLTDGRWQITQLVDTRREECEMPAEDRLLR